METLLHIDNPKKIVNCGKVRPKKIVTSKKALIRKKRNTLVRNKWYVIFYSILDTIFQIKLSENEKRMSNMKRNLERSGIHLYQRIDDFIIRGMLVTIFLEPLKNVMSRVYRTIPYNLMHLSSVPLTCQKLSLRSLTRRSTSSPSNPIRRGALESRTHRKNPRFILHVRFGPLVDILSEGFTRAVNLKSDYHAP